MYVHIWSDYVCSGDHFNHTLLITDRCTTLNYVQANVDDFSEFAAGYEPTIPVELSAFLWNEKKLKPRKADNRKRG